MVLIYLYDQLNNIIEYLSIVKVIKYIIKWWTNSCEITRICNTYHSSTMSLRFAKSLKKSKQLETYRNIVYRGCNVFNVQAALDNIVTVKKISKNSNLIIITNITHCLHALRYINSIMFRLDKLRKKQFTETNNEHLSLLESLWDNMKPNIRRNNETINNKTYISSDWCEIGFQGKDPSTDFRGFGMLGLVQLEYFARVKGEVAKSICLESMHSRRYYPYAATGINITAFVFELLIEHRFHSILFNCLQQHELKSTSNIQDGPSANETLIDIGINIINDLYCEIYEGFNELWVRKDPENVLAFRVIFDEYKNYIRKKYPTI